MSEKLNCWPGCVAMVVGNTKTPGIAGRLVIVVERAFSGDKFMSCDGSLTRVTPRDDSALWRIRPACDGTPLPWKIQDGSTYLHKERAFADKNLRPLRDDEGEDEMLRIAGLPNKETTPV